MAVDFSHLRKLDVNEQSEAEYTFDDIPGEPSIWLRPMTDANEAYLNERMRIAIERAEQTKGETRTQRKQRMLSSAQLEEDRELDRVLIARTCAVRWGTAPKDAKGKTPEFSEANCYDFFKALPNYMFDPLRGWVSNVYNFVDPGALATEEDAEKLGNS